MEWHQGANDAQWGMGGFQPAESIRLSEREPMNWLLLSRRYRQACVSLFTSCLTHNANTYRHSPNSSLMFCLINFVQREWDQQEPIWPSRLFFSVSRWPHAPEREPRHTLQSGAPPAVNAAEAPAQEGPARPALSVPVAPQPQSWTQQQQQQHVQRGLPGPGLWRFGVEARRQGRSEVRVRYGLSWADPWAMRSRTRDLRKERRKRIGRRWHRAVSEASFAKRKSKFSLWLTACHIKMAPCRL